MGKLENLENIENEDMKAAFERWKSKSYALTVPLRVVALEGSLPPIWIRVRIFQFENLVEPNSENVLEFMFVV